MSSAGARGEPFEPFFLPAAHGERFCIYHPAAGGARGGVVYVHPFAEEMNKARHMAALQSRMFAKHGFAVLQIDLFGCGDSSGEFGEARWELWKEDVALAVAWLRQRAGGTIHLWGLRLGALLALDYAAGCGETFGGYLLWQPVVSGEAFLTQFLRLRVATEMIAEGTATTGTGALRGELNAGAVVEVAGYELAPQLARAIDGLKLAGLAPRGAPVHWFEVVAEAGRALPPAARRVADQWIAGSVELNVHAVAGEPFWNTLEITDSPALLDATLRVIGQRQR